MSTSDGLCDKSPGQEEARVACDQWKLEETLTCGSDYFSLI